MNENPGETPNPLNQNQPVQPTQPTQPVADVDGGPLVESLDPAGRPMQKAAEPAEAPKPKKKVGLIAGIIAAVAVLICGGVAIALAVMNMNKSDAVAAAMDKLMSGNAPANVAIDGTIDILPNDADSPISRISIALQSGLIMSSNINTSSAVMTVVTNNAQEFSVEFSEVYAANGDLYFRIDGATAAIEDSGILEFLTNPYATVECDYDDVDCIELEETNCIEDETGMTNCEVKEIEIEEEITDEELDESSAALASGILNILEVIDGEWIRISTDEMGLVSDGMISDSEFSCVNNLVNTMNKSSNSAAELYNKYPFFTSSNEGLVVSSKNDPIYKLELNAENFANFVNSIENSSLSSELYSCLDVEENVYLTEEDAAELIAEMPEMYVEVDANNNFTRFYANSETDDGGEVIIDLSFSYPANVNVSEPTEYVDFSDIIEEIMRGMFELPYEVDDIFEDTTED